MSADPLTIHGLGSDLNPYVYVESNPVVFHDPYGLDKIPAGAKDIHYHPGGWSAYVNGELEVGNYESGNEHELGDKHELREPVSFERGSTGDSGFHINVGNTNSRK